jgi:hypothetical protein
VKRAIFLATAALLAMLLVAPITMAQVVDGSPPASDIIVLEHTMVDDTTMVVRPDGSLDVLVPPTGGPAVLLPAAALLLGSGILTYAILRRG